MSIIIAAKDATKMGPATFLRINNNTVPSNEPQVARANALVAHEGIVVYMTCCSGGKAAMASGVMVTCRIYMVTPTMFHRSASTLMIQKAVVGFVVDVMG